VLNKYLKGVTAQSAAVKQNCPINSDVKKALIKDGCWREEYSSKKVDSVLSEKFDLVIALTSDAAKISSSFDDDTVVISIDYDEEEYSNPRSLERFIKTIKMELIPISRDILEL